MSEKETKKPNKYSNHSIYAHDHGEVVKMLVLTVILIAILVGIALYLG